MDFGKNESEQKPVKIDTWNPEQQALWKSLAAKLQSGIDSNVPKYPGKMYVPETSEESTYLSRANSIASELAAAKANLGKSAYEINSNTTEQYYKDVIEAPTIKKWQEIVEPQIRESFSGPGYWGSARANAQLDSSEDLATNLATARANLYYQDELSRREAAEKAAQREAQYGATYANEENAILGTAGQYSRMIDQEKVAADMQRWLSGETIKGVTPTQYNPFLQLVFQSLGLSQFAIGTEGNSSGFNFGFKSPFSFNIGGSK